MSIEGALDDAMTALCADIDALIAMLDRIGAEVPIRDEYLDSLQVLRARLSASLLVLQQHLIQEAP